MLRYHNSSYGCHRLSIVMHIWQDYFLASSDERPIASLVRYSLRWRVRKSEANPSNWAHISAPFPIEFGKIDGYQPEILNKDDGDQVSISKFHNKISLIMMFCGAFVKYLFRRIATFAPIL